MNLKQKSSQLLINLKLLIKQDIYDIMNYKQEVKYGKQKTCNSLTLRF